MCIIDHRTEGFDGQQVYIFRGSFKSKLARVLSMSGGLVKVEVDSAIRGSGILFVQADYVFVCVSCILIFFPFTDFRLASAHAHSEMEVNLPGQKQTSKIFPTCLTELLRKHRFQDPQRPQFLSGKRNLSNRSSKSNTTVHAFFTVFQCSFLIFFCFFVCLQTLTARECGYLIRESLHFGKLTAFSWKIEVHRDLDVAGRRNGLVLRDPNAPTSPLPESIPANVLVEYKNRRQQVQVESLPVSTLRVTAPSQDEKHMIVKGERTGKP